jgi:hypothetical protein
VLVDVLLDAQEHSLTGISRDDLLASVREKITAATDLETSERLTAPDHFDIDARMKSLNARGVVDRWQDAAKKSMARAGCKGIYDSLTHISEWVSQDFNEDAWWNYHLQRTRPHQIIEWPGDSLVDN